MMDDQTGLELMCAMLNGSLNPSDSPLWQVLPEGQDQSEGIRVKELNDILLESCYKVIDEKDGSVHLPQNQQTFNIVVETETGQTLNFKVKSTDTIKEVKEQIQIVNGIPVDQQRLIYCGKQLCDPLNLFDYDITEECTLQLVLRMKGGRPSLLPRNLLNPRYHKDFTKIMDQIVFRRGGEIYKRPRGCYRYALRVDGKYSDDVWLGGSTNPLSELIGISGERRDTLDGEWPVSYHGTSYNNGLSIAKEGFQLSKGQRFLYGRGIYSTPDIDVAFLYAPTVELKGKEYKIVIQNRVNPVGLIKVSKEETGVGEYWISASDEDVRPYGFCVQEVNKTDSHIFNCVIL